MYIRFNDSNVKYHCEIEKRGDDVKVMFHDEFLPDTSGFRIYSDNGKLLGNYPEHCVIKESFSDGFLYTTELGESTDLEKVPTLGERLEEANKKIEELSIKLNETQEALDCTNNAMEELLFNYILAEEGGTEENE